MSEEIKTEIALLRRDIHHLDGSMLKIDGLVDTVTTLAKDVAIHIKGNEAFERRLAIVENDANEFAASRVLYERGIHDLIAEKQRMDEQDRERRHKELLATITSMNKEIMDKIDEQDKRLDALERWRYYLLGVAGLALLILSKIEFPNLF